MSEYSQSREFYDRFSEKLIKDFLIGNPRITSALSFANSNLKNAGMILDIGCGIGWSSFSFACNNPKSEVVGLDLSPNLIDVANSLFQLPNLRFETRDITQLKFKNSFDTVIMLDVYEHIKVNDRTSFHSLLNSLLTINLIILTCPTKDHQQHLRKFYPDRLQPVDEDVTETDLNNFAKEVGGTVTFFNKISVWNKDDYFHSIIERNVNNIKEVRKVEFENREERFKRVRNSTVFNNISSSLTTFIRHETNWIYRQKQRLKNIIG